METKQGVIKRRMSRIKGVCYIPGGETPYEFEVPTKEETAGIVVPFLADDVDKDGKVVRSAGDKVHDYLTRGIKRDAKLEASGGLSDTVKKDSAFAIARMGIKNMLDAMQKGNKDATLKEAAEAWFAIPGMKSQLEAEGVIFGEPAEDEVAAASSGSADDEDEDDED